MAEQNKTSKIFEPMTFLGMVQAFEPDKSLQLFNSVKPEPSPLPEAYWTVKYGRAGIAARPNTPNSKANPRDFPGTKQLEKHDYMLYFREGAGYTPTAALFQKRLDSGERDALVPFEEKVADETKQVADGIDKRIEDYLWQAVQ